MFGTWGPGDLTELQRNMKFYNLPVADPRADSFLRCTETVRDPVRNDEEPPGARVRRRLPPSPEGRAFSSGAFGCKIYGRHFCARIDMDVVLAYDSIDVYQNPKSKKEEIHAVYNGYMAKFISREFDTKRRSHARSARSAARTAASAGKRQEKRLRWFSAGGKTTTA